MQSFEYKVVPAPQRGQKARGVRGTEARFALAIERVINEMAEGGWEYQRTDTLPCEERSTLHGSSTTYQSVLIFRRARPEDVAAFQPRQIATPEAPRALPQPQPEASDDAPIRPARPAARDGLSLVREEDEEDSVADLVATPVPASKPQATAPALGQTSPALLARARQLAARSKSDVAAE